MENKYIDVEVKKTQSMGMSEYIKSSPTNTHKRKERDFKMLIGPTERKWSQVALDILKEEAGNGK